MQTKTLWLAAIVLLLSGPARPDELPRTISVSGTGLLDIQPDIARLSFAVQQRDPIMKTARDATVQVSQRFLALCKRLGIPDAKVRSSGLTIQPEYRWDPKDNRQIFTGYFVQRQLAVELGNLDRLGELIEGAIDAGVNEVSPPAFDSSRRKALDRDALAAAATDARANALRIAETLGVTLGPLRTLTAGPAPAPPMPMPRMRAAALSADAGAAESYQPGAIGLESRVEATFDVVVR